MKVLCFVRRRNVFYFKQTTAYELRISDWSSDVCSSDLLDRDFAVEQQMPAPAREGGARGQCRTIIGRVAIGGDAIFGRSLDPRIFLVEDEVDDTRHGEIGRASCRERVCQYV